MSIIVVLQITSVCCVSNKSVNIFINYSEIKSECFLERGVVIYIAVTTQHICKIIPFNRRQSTSVCVFNYAPFLTPDLH